MARFSEITARLSGISCPLFGVQWEPAIADVEIARGVIAFLEDRRVLYEPSEVEVPRHCIQSAIEIRHRMTDLLARGRIGDGLSGHLRAIRAACREFVGQIGDPDDERGLILVLHERANYYNGLHDYRLNQALGALRAVVGLHVAQLAVKYGIDIEPPLELILPPAEV